MSHKLTFMQKFIHIVSVMDIHQQRQRCLCIRLFSEQLLDVLLHLYGTAIPIRIVITVQSISYCVSQQMLINLFSACGNCSHVPLL